MGYWPVSPQPIPSLTPVNITQVSGSAISLGQKTMATSFPVVIASDQSTLPVSSVARVISGRYRFTLVDAPGVAAANVFLTLFNPAASIRILRIVKVRYRPYGVAVTIAKVSMRLTRISSSTLGTLQAAGNIFKLDTSYVNATAEVRTANPTIVAVNEADAFQPAIVITAAASAPIPQHTFDAIGAEEELILRAGEGVAFRMTAAGDVDQTYDIMIEWVEI